LPGTTFRLNPIDSSVIPLDGHKWRIALLPSRVELIPVGGAISAGWVVLSATLNRKGRDFSATLIAETFGPGGQPHYFPLPATRKGKIFELIYLPPGVSRLFLEPMRSLGTFSIPEISMLPVSNIERVIRMWRRVIDVCYKTSRIKRHKVGLRFYLPFLDIQKAYLLAGRLRTYAPELSYNKWLKSFDSLKGEDRRAIRQHIKTWEKKPHFEIFISTTDGDSVGIRNTLASLQRQLYRNFTTHIITSSAAIPDSLQLLARHRAKVLFCEDSSSCLDTVNTTLQSTKRNTWVICLPPGTELSRHTLYWLAYEAQKHPHTRYIYADHDHLDERGDRTNPEFKPSWSVELLRSSNYIGIASAIHMDTFLTAACFPTLSQDQSFFYDLNLRATEKLNSSAIRHIPAVLWHLREIPDGDKTSQDLVSTHLDRMNIAACVSISTSGQTRTRYQLPTSPPVVSIIIPTRDSHDLLRSCVESVLLKSSYKQFEIIVVDNLSSDQDTLNYLEELPRNPRVKVLSYAKPFNYSAINNFAVSKASGSVICLLNNDTEVISSDWIEEMLGHLLQPGVGIVGAKLLYGDGRVQHAGDTVGPGGCAHHLHAMLEKDDPGYCNRAVLAQDLSAVTAACMFTWKDLYEKMGGLDGRNLPVAFNDVDYCLRVRKSGLRVVWTPHALLYHHESVSRGLDRTPESIKRARKELAYMRRAWKHVMNHDPFYNPNLSYSRPDFSLSNTPIVWKPWHRKPPLVKI